MKYCIKCGKKLADDAMFCDSCGARQDGETSVSPAENKTIQQLRQQMIITIC